MKKTNKITAFSLAEVLLTLIIIGTISTLTIQTLKNHSDETKYIASVQKAMAQISAATINIEAIHGDASLWNFSSNDTKTWYKNALNIIPFPNNKDIWTRSNMDASKTSSTKYNFMTADGMAWIINTGSYKCGGGVALVDVNGINGPNVIGIDQHGFRLGHLCGGENDTTKLGEFGIYALGDGLNDNDATWACTAYIIKNKKMPWLYNPSTSCAEYQGK